MIRVHDNSGFTLVEVVMVIIIAGILVTIAFQAGTNVYDTARFEETRQELDLLACAVTGNPDLNNNGVRTDFGYVGDIGALPPDLDALMQNPGGYTTWKGPYFQNRFSQVTDDYKTDAWGKAYEYNGLTITSKGKVTGGSGCGGPTTTGDIVRRICSATGELLVNRVSGTVFDRSGTLPGDDYRDSVRIVLTVPDGSGGFAARVTGVTSGGYFTFDSIPIGNHNLDIIYLPDNDTLSRFVSVTPKSTSYNEYYLVASPWSPCSGGLTRVPNSDSLKNDCHGFFFWIRNDSGSDITVSSVVLTWSGTTAYYRYVIWGGVFVFDRNNPKAASGEQVFFSSPQTISDGETVKIEFDNFRTFPNGGSQVDMDNTDFTVVFSDGTNLNVSTEDCP
ncbi:MAG: prepilin-type N-terminal cleavage/methylation domain-containing protein [candidate division Zixibacteria bacterium]|nr:prepilin-type N-terminal cleavage/methylation domain-containing protein [candidate division Zixibacteria bacterium]